MLGRLAVLPLICRRRTQGPREPLPLRAPRHRRCRHLPFCAPRRRRRSAITVRHRRAGPSCSAPRAKRPFHPRRPSHPLPPRSCLRRLAEASAAGAPTRADVCRRCVAVAGVR
eukprot:6212876-Pleurochrysis_carterae.AAC.2